MLQLALDWLLDPAPAQPVDLQQNPALHLTGQGPAAPEVVAAQAAAPPAPAAFSHPRANRRIALAGACVAYEFKRGRRRTIGFAVGPEGLTVRAPRWTALAEVDAALREKARWIVAKLGEARTRAEQLAAARICWQEGAQFDYLGAPVRLALDPRRPRGPAGALLAPEPVLPNAAGGALVVGLPREASGAQLRAAVQAWLMRQARRLFTERLDHFAPLLGVHWRKLGLSSAGTRWGSAGADGSIRLNWRLIHLRPSVIDYVVVHELAHLREMNHSPHFWRHVQNVLPDYAERRGHLRGAQLPVW
jgi:predicted metal-dependent hydrolase